MSTLRSPPSTPSRAMRADARRNRDAILAAARETFEEDGVLASLDGIATRAGVGNATLYRNFPTRDDLLASVLEANVAALLASADELSRSQGPREAFNEWLFELTWQLRIWHDLPYCVASASCNQESSMNPTTSALLARTKRFLSALKASGQSVSPVTPKEVFELVTTLSWGVDRYGDDERAARRRVALATAGLFTANDPHPRRQLR